VKKSWRGMRRRMKMKRTKGGEEGKGGGGGGRGGGGRGFCQDGVGVFLVRRRRDHLRIIDLRQHLQFFQLCACFCPPHKT